MGILAGIGIVVLILILISSASFRNGATALLAIILLIAMPPLGIITMLGLGILNLFGRKED